MKNRVVSAACLAHRGALCRGVTAVSCVPQPALRSLPGDPAERGAVPGPWCVTRVAKAQIRALSQRGLGADPGHPDLSPASVWV